MWGQFDRIDWAGFFAHSAVNASEFVDVKLLWVLLAVGPRTLSRHNVNAIRWAGRRTHEARDAAHTTILVFVQPVDSAKGRSKLSTLFDWAIIALLLWVLHDPKVFLVGAIPPNVLEKVAQGRPESSDDVRNEEVLRKVQLRRGDIDDLVVSNRHT